MTRERWLWVAALIAVLMVAWIGRGLVCFGGWPH